MSGIITLGLDLAKNVFRAHGAETSGQAVLPKKLRRSARRPAISLHAFHSSTPLGASACLGP